VVHRGHLGLSESLRLNSSRVSAICQLLVQFGLICDFHETNVQILKIDIRSLLNEIEFVYVLLSTFCFLLLK
jgi:hypothetical protein